MFWQAHKKEAAFQSDVCGILGLLNQSAHPNNFEKGHLILEVDARLCEMEKAVAIFLKKLPFKINT